MAGNKFTKKLQAIKSKMMFDDKPVDVSKRKLMTLPTEQSSSTPQITTIETIVSQPLDRRGFLNKMANTAKSTALRGALPELGRLVEPVAEKAIKATNPFDKINDKIRQSIIDDMKEHIGNYGGVDSYMWYNSIRDYISSDKVNLSKLDDLASKAEDGDEKAGLQLYKAMPKAIKNIESNGIIDVYSNLPSTDWMQPHDIIETVNKNANLSADQMREYLSSHWNSYDDDLDGWAVDEVINNPQEINVGRK
jgi:hypothetical protein